VHALKYRRLTAVAPTLARLAGAAYGHAPQGSAIVPVPSHRARTAARGLDHTRVLAEAVAWRLGVSCLADTLVRERDTVPQVTLTAEDRAANVAGAFRAVRPVALDCAVLVDDVLTTGATAAACADALLAAGAGRVEVCAVARAIVPPVAPALGRLVDVARPRARLGPGADPRQDGRRGPVRV
jgi:predicted amidophosphoribosyltransferase